MKLSTYRKFKARTDVTIDEILVEIQNEMELDKLLSAANLRIISDEIDKIQKKDYLDDFYENRLDFMLQILNRGKLLEKRSHLKLA